MTDEPPRGRRPPARSRLLLVSDAALPPELAAFQSVTADRYLQGAEGTLAESLEIVNLCRTYQYLSKGYYVSLLAEARRQRALPALEMIEAANNPFSYLRALREAGLETIEFSVHRRRRRVVPRRIVVGDHTLLEARDEGSGVHFAPAPDGFVDVSAVLGKTEDRRFQRVTRAVWAMYSFPLLKVRMYRDGDGWSVGQIQPVGLPQATPDEIERLARDLTRLPPAAESSTGRPYRLACLWDPDDPTAPSAEETVGKLGRVAARSGLLVERIGRGDLARLAEYDALFIRTVTAIDHYSFTFSQTAESLGIPVIDDPASIIKCSNKIFLHELFRKHGLPTPETAVLSPRTWRAEVAPLGLPVILKVPDGTFSLAVKMARDEAELEALTREMFKRSPLLLAQRFTPTRFDWRVGVLEGEVLWVAKYHMAPKHWQIAKRSAKRTTFGRVEAVPLAEAPAAVCELALAGASLIGQGLYGVDLKDTESGPVIIEINDNPNLDVGLEDAADRDRPYEAIAAAFRRRIEESYRQGAAAVPAVAVRTAAEPAAAGR